MPERARLLAPRNHAAENPVNTFPLGHAEGQPVVVGRVGTLPPANGVEFAGQSVLNVTSHLTQLGFDPLLITRIGDDIEGREVLHFLDSAGISTRAVQIDDSLPTFDREPTKAPLEEPRCAWQALRPKPAVHAVDEDSSSLVYHGVNATQSEPIQAFLNTLQNKTGLPFFVDVDVNRRDLPMSTVRRALLGVKWIRTEADLLPVLNEHGENNAGSTPTEARALRSRFALDGVVADRRGLPTVAVSGDRIAHSTVSLPEDATFLPGGRDASAAALIVGVILGWAEDVMIERAVQLAFLAGGSALAHGVDPSVYSIVLRHWLGVEPTAVDL